MERNIAAMGITGSSAKGVVASLALGLFAQPLAAREAVPPPIRIEAGPLSAAISTIARAGGVEIVSLEPGLSTVRTGGRALPADPAAALRILLRGTGYRAVAAGPHAFRIERAARVRPERAPRHAPPRVDDDAITVIAGRFPTPLADYPGSVLRIPAESGARLPETAQLGDLARLSPVVFATAFGDGRDKFFIRGIADSSFNGAAKPTTAIYVDDVPVSFGSPNPNVRLYDIASIEVLEGPQGTLYGAGSIGGVIRVTPNPVDLENFGGMATAEGSVQSGGQPGWKVGGAANLPIARGTAGLRLVGYNERQGGYIDDPVLGKDVNRIDVSGGRATFALDLPSGLRVDVGGLYQSTRAADAQFADGQRPLVRNPARPQPYRSDVAVGRLSVRQRWDSGIELASVLSLGHRTSNDRFDATFDVTGSGASVYDIDRSSSVITSETRLSRTARTGLSWVVAVNLQRITDGQSRTFGSPDGAPSIDEVTNDTRSASVFVQGRIPIGRKFDATLGLRYTVARTDSEPARGTIVSFVRGETAAHFDPTIALLYRLDRRWSLIGRYQTGYRNGGVTVARGVGRVADFMPDAISMGEAGVRLNRTGMNGLAGSLVVSYADWRRVLAELVTRRGTPVTENIGDARLLAVEGNAEWRSAGGLRLGAALLYTANSLSGDLAGQTPLPNRRLPDTPDFSARLHAGYDWQGPRGYAMSVMGRAAYVGRSVLGPGPVLDLSQGDFAQFDLRTSAQRGRLSLWVALDNVLNSQANRFALGNPLLLYRREGFAPLAPRRLSAGMTIAY
ncbi:TonB-dependent receptor [Novosphingobium flavum]|uniref:TonB-dependent receptor n=1 Tax=Novosphingobium flavum TaxID=1778672 RepID=A0A7X1KK06_9SPHN|nr:TonB-dependent receptor [Novosphingobium flavum]MBC2664031.1 TonB-dependent receptor [Novosphingobium flavum]